MLCMPEAAAHPYYQFLIIPGTSGVIDATVSAVFIVLSGKQPQAYIAIFSEYVFARSAEENMLCMPEAATIRIINS